MTTIIDLKNVMKEFKVQRKSTGKFGFIKDLFSTDAQIIRAVKNISFSIEKGEVVGFIGPNGAGKSTTLKMLTGVLVPTAGIIHVNGLIPYKNRTKYVKDIGVVFGQRSQLWWDLSVIESFKMIKELYEVSDFDFEENLRIFEEELNISELFYKSVRHLSLGQKMLCEVVSVLLHNPDLIFLDEPTIGLDISTKTKIRKIISRMNSEKQTTVLLTTHDMSDIEALCKKIIVIDHGSIIFNDDIQNMYRLIDNKMKKIEITLSEPACIDVLDNLRSRFENDSFDLVAMSPTRIEVIYNNQTINTNRMLDEVIRTMSIEDINIRNEDIENIVKKIYDGHLL
ncbi:ABC transporter ATP-binding protein [Paenibacillus solani]|uniref:ABC transporter ATP-binding protein n=1 Tax=Paenibacillus solani TaxID=1705565 RepID=UPI003D2A1E39